MLILFQRGEMEQGFKWSNVELPCKEAPFSDFMSELCSAVSQLQFNFPQIFFLSHFCGIGHDTLLYLLFL